MYHTWPEVSDPNQKLLTLKLTHGRQLAGSKCERQSSITENGFAAIIQVLGSLEISLWVILTTALCITTPRWQVLLLLETPCTQRSIVKNRSVSLQETIQDDYLFIIIIDYLFIIIGCPERYTGVSPGIAALLMSS